MNGLNILVDPMLSEAGEMDPIANGGNDWRIPMVDLPLSATELQVLLRGIDAVMVTHTHRDHWDARAQALVPKQLPLFCQPADRETFETAGFTHVLPVVRQLEWKGLLIERTGGQHGTGELGKKMGPVSGFVVRGLEEPTLYIAGDTIWCPEVEQALEQSVPAVVVLNAGAATFTTGGGPITMDDDDVCHVSRAIPFAKVVAVHMEVVNHCRLTRAALRDRINTEGLNGQVMIPDDGAVLNF